MLLDLNYFEVVPEVNPLVHEMSRHQLSRVLRSLLLKK